MTEITCDIGTLHGARPTDLVSRLSWVSPIRPYVEPKARPNELILVARYGNQITTAERDWQFPSLVSSIRCRYMERWLPIDQKYDPLRLRNAYFHLDHHEGPDNAPQEIFAFHWEPIAEINPDDVDAYVRRPHLHIRSAREPLGHSHLVATLTVSDDDQSNVAYLDELLNEVFRLVEVEVLGRINSAQDGSW